MKLVILVGNSSVGKMSVGQELMKITELRLFHNHMTIEPVIEIFGSHNRKVVQRLREVIFEEFAALNNYGMIFTYMWAFNLKSDWDYIAHVSDLFKQHGAKVYYVELVTSQEKRLERNRTANRLSNKASKRHIEESNKRLLDDDEKYRCASYEGEVPFENYMRIDNTDLSPELVAQQIKDRFKL